MAIIGRVVFEEKRDGRGVITRWEGKWAYHDNRAQPNITPLPNEEWEVVAAREYQPPVRPDRPYPKPVFYLVLGTNLTKHWTNTASVWKDDTRGWGVSPKDEHITVFISDQTGIEEGEWEIDLWGPSYHPGVRLIKLIRSKEQILADEEAQFRLRLGGMNEEEFRLLAQQIAEQYGITTSDLTLGWGFFRYSGEGLSYEQILAKLHEDGMAGHKKVYESPPVMWDHTSRHNEVWRAGGREAHVIPGTSLEEIRTFFVANGISEEPQKGMYERQDPDTEYGHYID